MRRSRLPTSRAVRLAEGIAKDYDKSKEKLLDKILPVTTQSADYWKERYAHARSEQWRLGDKLALWSQLIGQSAGLDISRTPSDEEAQAILVGWATQKSLILDVFAEDWSSPEDAIYDETDTDDTPDSSEDTQ